MNTTIKKKKLTSNNAKELIKKNKTAKLKNSVKKLSVSKMEDINTLFSKLTLSKPTEDLCIMEDTRTKEKAASNEEKDIAFIVKAIKNKDTAGLNFINAFKEKFGLDIQDVRERKGSRKTHYDFEIQVNGEWKHVEHKGSKGYKPISSDKKVWASGVQFYNGPADKFSLAKKYAKTWYDTYIGSGELKKEWKIEAETPSYDEWYSKDCKVLGDPKTPFGKELKKKVREKRGPKASLLDKREAINSLIEMTKEEEDTFINEVYPLASEVLEDKDYWLVIHGDLTNKFHFAWFPKFKLPKIISLKFKKCLDLEFDFICEDDYVFNGILRWGKGAGFSCLRIDLK
uniref:Uncharacterized protein n=1 Tax=viral metagenome TaxID=1070528 RepID=A0A6C0D4Y3_9ZZZZ